MNILLSVMLMFGQDISIKPVYEAPVGKFVIIQAESKGSDVVFVPLDDSQSLSILDNNLLKDKKTLVLVASKPGNYKLLAYSSIDNKPTQPVFTTIKISNEDKPKPNNDLEQILNAVYGADQDNNKSQYKDKLIVGFKNVIKDIDSLNSVGDLNLSIRDKVTSKLQAGEGQAVRDVLRDEFSNQFGIDKNAVLDKAQAKKVLQNVVDILSKL